MTRLLSVLLIVIVLIVSLSLMGPGDRPLQAATACTTSGTVTADSMASGPFIGLWKYTISANWDTGGAGLSHISFLITYACDCCDVNNLTEFDSPAGTSTGEDSLGAACTAEYIGLGDLCTSDPTVGSPKPAIKFEQIETGCEAVSVGSGTFCFYSSLPPLASATYTDAVAVKYGISVCNGDLTGPMPDCLGCLVVPTEERTLGSIKSDYELLK